MRDPWFLLGLAAIPLLLLWRGRSPRSSGVSFPSAALADGLPTGLGQHLRRAPLWLRCAALALLCVALARPQRGLEDSKITTEGIDIMLAVDVSTSMLAEDFKVGGRRANRLEAVVPVVEDFIEKRRNDRIGMVVFAGRAYTQCPLTAEHGLLLQFLEKLEIGMIEDGTAIGSAIATATKRLTEAAGETKVAVLLTDGRNNAGQVDPATAAGAAAALDVRIYTVGAGTRGRAPYPVRDIFGQTIYQSIDVEIDEKTLTQVAEATGGRYFRATDTKSLQEIYAEIDRMETTEIELEHYGAYLELFPGFAVAALGLLALETALSTTRLRRLP